MLYQSRGVACLSRLISKAICLPLVACIVVLSMAGSTNAQTFTINDVSVCETDTGTVNAVFTVTLTPACSVCPATVDFATADDSATTAGGDYVANSGTLTFGVGVTTQTITVVVNGDTIIEGNETFFVNLSAPVNATITDSQGVGSINNNDATLSIDDVSACEGDTGMQNAVFTVTMSNANKISKSNVRSVSRK